MKEQDELREHYDQLFGAKGAVKRAVRQVIFEHSEKEALQILQHEVDGAMTIEDIRRIKRGGEG